MIRRIAQKELLLNLLTFRFTLGTLLFLALTLLFTLVLLGDYRQRLKAHDQRVATNGRELQQLMTYQNLKPTIYKPPEPLALFAKGIEDNIGDRAGISIGEVPMLTSAAGISNPFLTIFPLLDITLVFKLVISVLALLVAYDTISGEREDGTLALTLSNSVPRHAVLFGKFLGGMLTLAIPITLGFLVMGLLLEVSPALELTGSAWARIALMWIVSLLLVGVLLNIGLLVSSLTRRASDTLLLLLFLWVLFVTVIPNGSAYLAGRLRPIEPHDKARAQAQEVWGQFDKEISDYRQKLPSRNNWVQSDAREPWGWYHQFATKALIQHKQKLFAFSELRRVRYAEEAWQGERRYLDDLLHQKRLAELLARASPISLYESLMMGFARTDVASGEHFAQEAREYRHELVAYLQGKEAFSSLRYFTTVEEDALFDIQEIDEFDALSEKYGTKKPALDVSDVPRFRDRPETISASLNRMLPDLALLCVLGFLAFSGAFVAFLRYDVR